MVRNMGSTHLRSVIPVGGSIPQPRPMGIRSYETICDNGGRRVKAYYLNGVRCNVFGFPISETAKEKLACHGCKGFRCDTKRDIRDQTSRADQHFSRPKKTSVVSFHKKRPIKTNYHQGPLPVHEKQRYDKRHYVQKLIDIQTSSIETKN